RLRVGAGFPSAPRAVPHFPQNLAWAVFSNPQLGQLGWSRVPHSVQKAIPLAFSNPQLGQRKLPLYSFGLPRARKRWSGHHLTTVRRGHATHALPENNAIPRAASTVRFPFSSRKNSSANLL